MRRSPKMPELPVVLRGCRHGPMFVLTTDRYVGGSLTALGEYSEGEIQLLCDLLMPGDTVVEAGSHIGAHTVPLARKVGGAGRLIAFEPQRALYRVLRANIALNNLGRIVDLRLAAVDEVARTLHAPVFDYSVVDSFGGFPDTMVAFTDSPNKAIGHEPVPTMTIDELRLSSCSLLKADVEGMELAVIGGAMETIERCRPTLYLEAHPGKTRALFVSIDAMGYRLWRHTPPMFSSENYRGAKVNPWPGSPLSTFSRYRRSNRSPPAWRPYTASITSPTPSSTSRAFDPSRAPARPAPAKETGDGRQRPQRPLRSCRRWRICRRRQRRPLGRRARRGQASPRRRAICSDTGRSLMSMSCQRRRTWRTR